VISVYEVVGQRPVVPPRDLVIKGGATGDYFLPAFFLPAMARRGPLRVRALVCVR
jgi:hypothetical protein